MSETDVPGFMVFKEWFRKQSHFPQKFDDTVILRFLHSCYYDLELAQKAVETFFSMRSSCPHIFSDRDPLQENMQNTLKYCKMAQYPISGNRFLWIWQIDDPGLRRYNAMDEAKLSSLVTDTWLLTNKNLEESDVVIICAKNVSFRMLFKFNVTICRAQVKYHEEAMPIRLKEIHFVNCTSTMDRIFTVYKAFMNPEVAERIRFHLPNSETLFEHINKDDLPKELGGNRESLEYLTELAVQRVFEHRDKILDDSYWINSINKSLDKT